MQIFFKIQDTEVDSLPPTLRSFEFLDLNLKMSIFARYLLFNEYFDILVKPKSFKLKKNNDG